MGNTTPDSEARRESARQPDGKFGPQERSEAPGGTEALAERFEQPTSRGVGLSKPSLTPAMSQPTFVPVSKSSRYPCEHVPDPESFEQCGLRATIRLRVHDPRRGNTWWSYACNPEHAQGVADEAAENEYEFREPEKG